MKEVKTFGIIRFGVMGAAIRLLLLCRSRRLRD
jgi:hypothetical protein